MCGQPGLASAIALILFVASCAFAGFAVFLSDRGANRWYVLEAEYAALISFLLCAVVVSTTIIWGCRW